MENLLASFVPHVISALVVLFLVIAPGKNFPAPLPQAPEFEIEGSAIGYADLENEHSDTGPASPASGELLANAASSDTPAPEYTITVDDAKIKSSLVNIFCASKKEGLYSMSGSGVVIDSRGVILTNAHIGQYYLLSEYLRGGSVNCVIRTGNPARTRYKAELLYIPSKWIENNSENIAGTKSKGTGENDFALLRISESASSEGLPGEFPFLEYVTPVSFHEGDEIVIAGYPAEFIPNENIGPSLYSLWAPTTVDKIYTFSMTSIDLFSMKGSYIAQRGSSGGAVVDGEGKLIGLIATASTKLYDNERKLYAITLGHIDRSLKDERGQGLSGLLGGNPSDVAANFQQDALELEKLLVAAIDPPVAVSSAPATTSTEEQEEN